MSAIHHAYQLILEMDQLKQVYRNTTTHEGRQESTAEHSWSAAMIVMILMDQLRIEFPDLDELKALKLILIHDTVEVYAGDVMAFDTAARKDKEKVEAAALKKLMAVSPEFAPQLNSLWYEFEHKQSIEAKVAKAADAICPMFQRLQAEQSYVPFNITLQDLEQTKEPHFKFSKTFSDLYAQLKADLVTAGLIA